MWPQTQVIFISSSTGNDEETGGKEIRRQGDRETGRQGEGGVRQGEGGGRQGEVGGRQTGRQRDREIGRQGDRERFAGGRPGKWERGRHGDREIGRQGG